MTTVKEFKDLGGEIVRLDKVNGFNINVPEYLNKNKDYDDDIIDSFAWRPLSTLPDNPKFKYEVNTAPHQWRPLLDQSSTETPEEKEVFDKMKPYEFDEHVSVAKPVFTQAMADTKSKFKSGQLIYIAQMNTLAGIVGKRYFVEQYWCGSLFQCEYVELGIIFDNKDDAEFKCKSLLGIDTRTPKQKAVDEMIKSLETFENEFVQLSKYEAGKLYDAGYRKC